MKTSATSVCLLCFKRNWFCSTCSTETFRRNTHKGNFKGNFHLTHSEIQETLIHSDTTYRGQGFGKRQTTRMHILCEICVHSERGMKGKKRKSQAQAKQGQHEAVKAAQQQPVSRAACREEGDINFRDTILVWFDFSLVCDHLPGCVSMETWRTLSSTWPGAGRNPTTQISA